MRSLVASLIAEKNTLATTSAWLPLVKVEIDASNILLLTPNPVQLTFAGETYLPRAVQIDQVQLDSRGGQAAVRVTVANVGREVSAYLETVEVRGARVTITYVNSANLADPTAVVLEERYDIQAVQVAGDISVVFTLGRERVASTLLPAARFYRDHCRFLYKSLSCGYAGTLPSCDHILEGANGCRAHSNIPRFGGFLLLTNVSGGG